MVRLRRKVGAGPSEIAALVPAFLFLPQVSTHGNPFSAYARIATASGTLIGKLGVRPDAADAAFLATSKSDKFGFNAEISLCRAAMWSPATPSCNGSACSRPAPR